MTGSFLYRLWMAAAVLLLAVPARAATLRPFTTLSAPVVRLGDLFAGAGSEAAEVLGPAPAPGSRISVEAPQLAAIARDFGVDWKPQTGFERAVLVRPGEPLRRAPVLAALRKALAGLGAAPGSRLVLDGFSPPILPVGAEPRIVVEQLSFDASEGEFQGVLAIALADDPGVTMAVAGRSVRTVALPVAAHRLDPGMVLEKADFVIHEIEASRARPGVLREVDAALGQTVRQAVPAGAPVPRDDLTPLPAVARGQRVRMEIAAPGLAVTAVGVALSDAATGERVDVLNPASHAVVRAAVLGPGLVEVAEGSIPLRGAGIPTEARR